MDNLLSQLRDIRGLDAVSWWPPAPGWWGIMVLLLAMCVGVYLYRLYRRKKAQSWLAEVKSLFVDVKEQEDNKKKIALLSDLLRRIAIKQYGRETCAGLEGREWLEWLTKHDPDGFRWNDRAQIFTEALYAPEITFADNDDIGLLIKAAERWVK